MNVVDFSREEIKNNLWIMDVLVISKKAIEENWLTDLNTEKYNYLNRRIAAEMEDVLYGFNEQNLEEYSSADFYEKNAYSLVEEKDVVKKSMDYLYSDICFEETIERKEMDYYINQMEKDKEFKKISENFYWSDGEIKEEFSEFDYFLENFDAGSCGEDYGIYSIKDKYILKYFEMIQGDREKEVIVKSIIASMVKTLDVCSCVLGYKLMENEMKVIVMNSMFYEIIDPLLELETQTQALISGIVCKYYMENEIRKAGVR